MSHKKPTPIVGDENKKICPVCGERSYSADGIHPQCAVVQADAPREQQLKEQRKSEANKKSPTDKPQRNWTKRCPNCGVEVHVRKKRCDCGFEFSKS